jgi:LysM repeat protein
MSFPSCPGGTNPGVDPQNLQIGQTVCIPGAPPSPPPGPCPGFFYVIQAGDTFFQLSQRFNVPLDAILAANPGVDPQSLQIGQTVCIPTGEPVCPGFIYTIQAGDTSSDKESVSQHGAVQREHLSTL